MTVARSSESESSDEVLTIVSIVIGVIVLPFCLPEKCDRAERERQEKERLLNYLRSRGIDPEQL